MPTDKNESRKLARIDNGTRIETLEINCYIYNQLIFNKSAKAIATGKD